MPKEYHSQTGVSPQIHKEEIFMPSSLETIDHAVYDWLNDGLKLNVKTNKGWKKVPIIWVASERSFQIKNKKELRDATGTLIMPLITIERGAVAKDLTKKGSIWGNAPTLLDEKGGSITIARKINQEKTRNFLNAESFKRFGQDNFPTKENSKIVFQTITIPIPVYLDVTYEISLRAEYQQQMNDLLTPFVSTTRNINYVILERDGHEFEGFVQQDLSLNNNINDMTSEERVYETKIELKVLGYIIGEGPNQEKPKIVIRENAVEYRIPRERHLLKDEMEHIDDRGFFREL